MSKHLFDPAIMAAPCRWPCRDFGHVHDEDLPPNFSARNDMDPENLNVIPKSSHQYEVWDE